MERHRRVCSLKYSDKAFYVADWRFYRPLNYTACSLAGAKTSICAWFEKTLAEIWKSQTLNIVALAWSVSLRGYWVKRSHETGSRQGSSWSQIRAPSFGSAPGCWVFCRALSSFDVSVTETVIMIVTVMGQTMMSCSCHVTDSHLGYQRVQASCCSVQS